MGEPESTQAYADRLGRALRPDRRCPVDPAGLVGWSTFPFAVADSLTRPLSPLADEEEPRAGEAEGARPCHGGSCAPASTGPDWRIVWTDGAWSLKVAPPSGSPVVLILEPLRHADVDGLTDEEAARLGVLVVHLVRAVESLPSVARCHVLRLGDGGAHTHVWFLARPARLPELRGSFFQLWDDLLPQVPVDVRDDNAAYVVDHLVATLGGQARR